MTRDASSFAAPGPASPMPNIRATTTRNGACRKTDDRALFEKLVLEGFQAGLSWLTILRKRDNFRRAFHDFDAERIARYGAKDIARLMADAGIVRNRAQDRGHHRQCPRAYLKLRRAHEPGGFLWGFLDGAPADQPAPRRFKTSRPRPRFEGASPRR